MAGLSGNIDHLNPIEVEIEVGLGLSLAKEQIELNSKFCCPDFFSSTKNGSRRKDFKIGSLLYMDLCVCQ